MEKNKFWEKDFIEFANAQPQVVPLAVGEKVIHQMHKELNPPWFRVFGKISLIHFVVGTLSLLFCPQFGISFASHMGLMSLLMRFGDTICMLGCGAIFTCVSIFIVSLSLNPEEVLVFKRNQFLQLLSLSGLSLGAFICLGEGVVLSLGLIWILGAILGGVTSLALGWNLRRSLLGLVKI